MEAGDGRGNNCSVRGGQGSNGDRPEFMEDEGRSHQERLMRQSGLARTRE